MRRSRTVPPTRCLTQALTQGINLDWGSLIRIEKGETAVSLFAGSGSELCRDMVLFMFLAKDYFMSVSALTKKAAKYLFVYVCVSLPALTAALTPAGHSSRISIDFPPCLFCLSVPFQTAPLGECMSESSRTSIFVWSSLSFTVFALFCFDAKLHLAERGGGSHLSWLKAKRRV